MLFFTVLRVSLRSLWASRLRSFLAVLGIVIGVGAVIAMLAVAEGAKSNVMQSINSMGTNLLVVRPGRMGGGGVMSGTQQNLEVEDAERLLSEVPGISRIAPVVQGRAQVKYFENNAQTTVLGVASTYFRIRNFDVEFGRIPTENECERGARVAVIGPDTVEELLGNDTPLRATIKVNGMNFRVIGVTKSKGDQGWFNPDDQVIIPYTTAMQSVLGVDYLNEIDIEGEEGADLTALQDKATEVLRRRHGLSPDDDNDFEIRNQAEILETASTIGQTFTLLLGSVAGISLLVGGIGIMNIMLVTVTERTREIGVRKAIGAKDRDILGQFLIEAVVMSLLGGTIGVLAGTGIAATVGAFTTFVPVVKPTSVILALTFACAIGIFFGYYPARRAAQLNPIDALRYE